MRVLVLGNDTPLGYSISAFANPLRRHELIGISIEKTRWGRERKVRRVVRDAAPEIVLDTRIVTQIDSSASFENKQNELWQHFCGVEIETDKDFFDEEIFNLMDFACDQRNKVHFFYTLPFTKRNALVETTWISELNNEKLKDYDEQIDNYLSNHLNIRNCKINFKETGAIPLFRQKNVNKLNEIYIGSAGGMTRLSTGYTFLNIQEQSKYIRENIENIKNVNLFKINSKYDFLDKILLRVLKNNSNEMGNIFFKVFNSKPKTAINFLSNKSSFFEDLEVILKMPKWKFLKELI